MASSLTKKTEERLSSLKLYSFTLSIIKMTDIELLFPNAAQHQEQTIQDWTAWDIGDVWGVVYVPDLTGNIVPELDQSLEEATKMSCTIAGAYKDRCRLWNRKATQEELLELVLIMEKNYGFNRKTWWVTPIALKNTLKELEKKYPELASYYITLSNKDDLFWEALWKWHFIWFTYRWNRDYNLDFMKDSVLNGTKFTPTSYGHRTSIRKLAKIGVYDNYCKRKINSYDFNDGNVQISNLIKNGNFYPNFYLILPKNNLDITKIKDKKAKDMAMQQKAIETWLWTGKRPNDFMIWEEFSAVMKRTGKNPPMIPGNAMLNRKFVAQTLSLQYGVKESEIWSWINPDLWCKRIDAMLMFCRVLYR